MKIEEAELDRAASEIEQETSWWGRMSPFRKSGEAHQPYGDQNKFNFGEMSPKKAKLFEYLSKLDDTEIEEIANNITDEYPNGVKKSLGDLKDPYLVVNSYIERGFDEITQIKEILIESLPALSKAIVALLKSQQAQADATEKSGFQPRATAKSVSGALLDGKKINPKLLLRRCEKAVSAGKLSAVDVSLIETRLNNPEAAVGIGEQAQLARILDIVEQFGDNVHPLQ